MSGHTRRGPRRLAVLLGSGVAGAALLLGGVMSTRAQSGQTPAPPPLIPPGIAATLYPRLQGSASYLVGAGSTRTLTLGEVAEAQPPRPFRVTVENRASESVALTAVTDIGAGVAALAVAVANGVVVEVTAPPAADGVPPQARPGVQRCSRSGQPLAGQPDVTTSETSVAICLVGPDAAISVTARPPNEELHLFAPLRGRGVVPPRGTLTFAAERPPLVTERGRGLLLFPTSPSSISVTNNSDQPVTAEYGDGLTLTAPAGFVVAVVPIQAPPIGDAVCDPVSGPVVHCELGGRLSPPVSVVVLPAPSPISDTPGANAPKPAPPASD